ncbi:MAG: hypothetical protein AVDCRST_MAG14-1692, partial [uncultured Rubrobacteraceae bacterium]
ARRVAHGDPVAGFLRARSHRDALSAEAVRREALSLASRRFLSLISARGLAQSGLSMAI